MRCEFETEKFWFMPTAHLHQPTGPSSSWARAERRDYIRSPTRGRDLGNPSAYSVGKFRRFPVIKMPVVAAHLYGENMMFGRRSGGGGIRPVRLEYARKFFRIRLLGIGYFEFAVWFFGGLFLKGWNFEIKCH